MRIIGLTGGIGSGKSTVATLFAELGATVVNADALAREAVATGSSGLSLILDRFGRGILDNRGALDRKKLGQIVFHDEQARHDLNKIVHPRVAALAQTRFQVAASQGAPLVVYDVPLLYENKLEAAFSAVVVVHASDEVRIQRLKVRDGLSEPDIRARMAAQQPLGEKAARADYVIENDGDRDALHRQVAALYKHLLEEERS